jgi:hypothetical protein
VQESTSNALISQDGLEFDWSDQAEHEVKNQALMAIVEENKPSEVPYEVQIKLCSPVCKQTVKHYRDYNMKFCEELKQCEIKSRHTTAAIENLENQIKAYEKNVTQYEYDLKYARWERDVLKDKLEAINQKLVEVTCERDNIKLTVSDLEHASKSVNQIIKSQIHDKIKTGLGYNSVSPPYNNNYFPPKTDLNLNKLKAGITVDVTKVDPVINLDNKIDFDKVEIREWTEEDELDYSSENNNNSNSETTDSLNSEKSCENIKKSDTGLVLELNSDKLEEGKKMFQEKKRNNLENMKTTANKSRAGLGYISNSVKTVNKSNNVKSINIDCADCKCKTKISQLPLSHKLKPRGNQRNWNQMVSQKLGKNFTVVKEKSCFTCGRNNHLQHDCYYNPKNLQRIRKQPWTGTDMINKQNFKSKIDRITTAKKKIVKANKLTATAISTASVLTRKLANSNKAKTVVKTKTVSVNNINTVSKIDKTVNTVRSISTVKPKISWIWTPIKSDKSKGPNTNCASQSMIFKKVDFVNAHGKPKAKLVWVPKRN